ncbi:MAG TPA: hypothetical protein VGM59_05250 [Dongiaceae bacterium]|jgi:hypothetical protein
MFIRNVVITGLATTLFSAAAFAVSSTPASTDPNTAHKASSLRDDQSTQQLTDRCSLLMSQFDQDITSHTAASKVTTAKSLRAKAGTECSGDHQSTGVRHLVQALKDIGVKASS